jgi:hypothetical protein
MEIELNYPKNDHENQENHLLLQEGGCLWFYTYVPGKIYPYNNSKGSETSFDPK